MLIDLSKVTPQAPNGKIRYIDYLIQHSGIKRQDVEYLTKDEGLIQEKIEATSKEGELMVSSSQRKRELPPSPDFKASGKSDKDLNQVSLRQSEEKRESHSKAFTKYGKKRALLTLKNSGLFKKLENKAENNLVGNLKLH